MWGEHSFSSSHFFFSFSPELFSGSVLSATVDFSRIAAEVENYWSQAPRTLQDTR